MDYVKNGGQWLCKPNAPDHGPFPCRVKHVVIKSDSAYLVNSMTDHIGTWQANGWINTGRQPVKNRDLWEELQSAIRDVEEEGAFVSFWHVERADNTTAYSLANYGLTSAL